MVVCLLPVLASAGQSAAPNESPQATTPQNKDNQALSNGNAPFGPISAYLGLPVSEIRFRGVAEREKSHLRDLISQKAGNPLDRDLVRSAINKLLALNEYYRSHPWPKPFDRTQHR